MSSKLCSFIPDTYVVAADKERFFDRADRAIIRGYEERENPKVGVPNASCNANLFFGFFFDGTKNNYRLAAKANEYSKRYTSLIRRQRPALCGGSRMRATTVSHLATQMRITRRCMHSTNKKSRSDRKSV
jgi:hypothetical protein